MKIIIKPEKDKSLEESIAQELDAAMKILKEKYPDLQFNWNNLVIKAGNNG